MRTRENKNSSSKLTVSGKNKKPQESKLYRCWRILFAVVGLLDCCCYSYCYRHDNSVGSTCKVHEGQYHGSTSLECGTRREEYVDDLWPIWKKFLAPLLWESMAYVHHPVSTNNEQEIHTNNYAWYENFRLDNPIRWMLWIHVGFGVLCVMEMLVRAIEARRIVFEHHAIAAFENRISEAVTKAYRQRKLMAGRSFVGGRSFYSLLQATETSSLASAMTNTTTTRTMKKNPYLPSFSSITASSSENSSVHRCHHIIEEEETNETETLQDTNEDDVLHERNIRIFLRATIQLWIPMGVTCCCWLTILPIADDWRIVALLWQSDARAESWNEHDYLAILGKDNAWATVWILATVTQWTQSFAHIQDYLVTTLWKQYLLAGGRHIKQRPKLVWKRIGRFLNFVKLVRFAGPLTRMLLKLSDQLFVGYSTLRKIRLAKTHKAQTLQRPSLLMKDLKIIESFHKIEITLASWPSECSLLLETLAREVRRAPFVSGGPTNGIVQVSASAAQFYAQDFLEASRQRGRQITRQLRWLQGQLRRGLTEFSSSEVYDNIRNLSRDMSYGHLLSSSSSSKSHESEANSDDHRDEVAELDSSEPTQGSTKPLRVPHASNRWYDYLHIESLLQSRDCLISPRSRFSVVWRITVTNCLLLELTRLAISWHLTQTFHLSITQVISRLFVDCSTIPEETKRHFRFVTDRVSEWHAALSHAIPFVPFPKDSLYILCVPTSQSSKAFLWAASMMEIFIDVVSFLDIFFWFFTGDLDAETGFVVPKAFFQRCILPGTLVQILDHPTLPTVLPTLMSNVGTMATNIGWSRMIRWLSALIPALTMMVLRPLANYFFRHFEEKDGHALGKEDLLMSFAESFGYLPQRNSVSLGLSPHKSALFLDQRQDRIKNNKNGDDHRLDRNPTVSANPQQSSTPPRSPVRSSLRSPSSNSPWRNASPDSMVRFANDASFDSERENDWIRNSSVYDIGLSLSSHALDGLQLPEFEDHE